jgi:hypothetical protein
VSWAGFVWYDLGTGDDVTPGAGPRTVIFLAGLIVTVGGVAVIPFATDLLRKLSWYLSRLRGRRTERVPPRPPAPLPPERPPVPRPPGSWTIQ